MVVWEEMDYVPYTIPNNKATPTTESSSPHHFTPLPYLQPPLPPRKSATSILSASFNLPPLSRSTECRAAGVFIFGGDPLAGRGGPGGACRMCVRDRIDGRRRPEYVISGRARNS